MFYILFAVRPLSVEILSSNQPFSADRKFEIPCVTYGSRPPARISWWMDNMEVKPYTYNHTQKVSFPKSTLSTPHIIGNGPKGALKEDH